MENNSQNFTHRKPNGGGAIYVSIAATSILLLSVIGAGFSYFLTSSNTNAVSKVEVVADARTSSWTESENIEMSVSAVDMSVGNTAEYYSDDAVLSAKTTNPDEDEVFICTYDLVYTPVGENVPVIDYVINPEGLAEIELTGVVTVYTGLTSTLGGETTFTQNLAGLAEATTLVEDVTYTVAADSTAGVTWTITSTVYNRDFDQTYLAGNSYGGSVTYDNFTCVAEQ